VGEKTYSKPIIQSYNLDRDCCLVLSSDGFDDIPTSPGIQQSETVNVFDENPFEKSAFD